MQIISDITSTLMFRNIYDLCMKFHIPNSSGSFVIAIEAKWKKLLLHLGSRFGECHLSGLSQ